MSRSITTGAGLPARRDRRLVHRRDAPECHGARLTAERYVERLPKASIGKACVRFKKLADLDEQALVALIKETAKMGLVA